MDLLNVVVFFGIVPLLRRPPLKKKVAGVEDAPAGLLRAALEPRRDTVGAPRGAGAPTKEEVDAITGVCMSVRVKTTEGTKYSSFPFVFQSTSMVSLLLTLLMSGDDHQHALLYSCTSTCIRFIRVIRITAFNSTFFAYLTLHAKTKAAAAATSTTTL